MHLGVGTPGGRISGSADGSSNVQQRAPSLSLNIGLRHSPLTAFLFLHFATGHKPFFRLAAGFHLHFPFFTPFGSWGTAPGTPNIFKSFSNFFLASTSMFGFIGISRYFNSYAFTYIAIYGKNFTASAKKTWDMLRKCGLDVIINDDIIGGTIMLSAFLVASMTGFVGAAWANILGIENWFWGIGLPCSLLGYVLGVITFNVVESAVLTIYVCFAEDPDTLYYNDRDLYEKLTDAQEMGVIADIDSDSSTESDDTSVGEYTTSEDEEDIKMRNDFDTLTEEQLADISSDDEDKALLDDEAKKKKKWYQKLKLPDLSSLGSLV